MKNRIQISAAMLAISLLANAIAIAQTGGGFEITQSVIATGGGTSSDAGGVFSIEGTIGQHTAATAPFTGTRLTGVGFWTPVAFTPTAANVAVSGRVLTTDGRGVRGVYVTLSGGDIIRPRTAISGTFGGFSFANVEVGHTYIVSVQSKRYGFPMPAQIISVQDNIADLLFEAGWTN